MLEQLRPCMTAKNAYDIDYKMLRRNNVRLVMFDIDNTLVPHGCTADQKCRDLIKRLKDMGFHVILISKSGRISWRPDRLLVSAFGLCMYTSL